MLVEAHNLAGLPEVQIVAHNLVVPLEVQNLVQDLEQALALLYKAVEALHIAALVEQHIAVVAEQVDKAHLYQDYMAQPLLVAMDLGLDLPCLGLCLLQQDFQIYQQ
jgi:hypothetical protein